MTFEKFIQNIKLLKNNTDRSSKAKWNTILLGSIKTLTIPISFLLVPLTIDYVNKENYGIWLTLSSIVAWMSFFDIGLNNGLRNRLGDSLAKEDYVLSRKLVSTSYALLTIVSSIIFLFFFIINFFIDWNKFLNLSSNSIVQSLPLVISILVGYFCLRFVLSTVQIILIAKQEPGKAAIEPFLEQLLILIIIYSLTIFTKGSLLYLSIALCIAPVIVLIFFNIFFFNSTLKNVAPQFKYIDFSLTKSLMGVGFKFFIIQLAGIIQFQTANFIIMRNYGAEDVTVYNIAFKYFNVLILGMSILISPLWSAVTDAYSKKDFGWIKNAEKKYRKLAFLIIILGLIMLFFSDTVYDFWLGKGRIEIPFRISFFLFLFNALLILGSVYCNILNGLSMLETQFKASILSPILFLILCYVFINYFKLGLESVIIASIFSNFNGYILAPIQYFNFSKRK